MSMPATPPGYDPQPQVQPPAVMPRWGYQASFIQKRQPAFWLFVILLAITGVVVLGRELEFIQVRPTAWFFSIPLLILYVAPLLVAIYVLDLFEREPISLLIAAFLWGGIVAIGFSGMTNTAWLQILQKVMGPEFARDWGPALVGPSVEETLKGLGVVVLFLVARAEFDDVFDGFVYGAVVGLGFAAVEDLHYFVRLSEANDQIGGVLYLYWVRVISAGLYGHVLYTGIVGMGFAYFVSRRDQPYDRRVLIGLGALGLAWLAHFIWNSPIFSFLIGDGSLVNWFITATVKGLPMFLAFAFLVYLAQRREARWFAYATARETGTDLLSSDEVRQLSDLRTRRAARKAVGARKGPAAEKLLGRLQREQINLAMVRTRVDHDEHPDLVRQRGLIRAIRAELTAIPDLPPLPTQVYVPGATVPPATGAPSSAEPGAEAVASPAAPPWAQTGTVAPSSAPVESRAQPTAQHEVIELGPGAPTQGEDVAGSWQPAGDAQSDSLAGPRTVVVEGGLVPVPLVADLDDEPAEPEPAEAEPEVMAVEPKPAETEPEALAAESAPKPTPTIARPGPELARPEPAATGAGTGVGPTWTAEPTTSDLGGGEWSAPASETARPAASQPSATPVRTPSSLFASSPSRTPRTAAAGQPAWQAQPAAAAQPSAAPVWAPTHLVPVGGMQAWATPDPSRPPIAMLAERLDLRVVERAADWAHVVASNGWTGWVDGRRLIEIGGLIDG